MTTAKEARGAAGTDRSLRRHASRTAVAVLVIAAFLGAWQARDLLFITILGLMFGATLAAPVDWLERRKVPRWAGVLLILAGVVGVVWAATLTLGPTLSAQAQDVRRQFPEAVERLSTWFGQTDLVESEEVHESARDQLLAGSAEILRPLLRLASSVVGLVAATLLVLAVAIWFAARPETYRRLLARLFPGERRATAELAVAEVEHTWRRWMAGQLVSMTVIGVLTTAALAWIGVPAPLALGTLAGLSEFIPVFGPLLTSVPALLLALMAGPTTALYTLIAYLAIQQIESNLVTPLVMRHAVRVPPLLTILVGSLFVVLGGIVGLLVAVPVLAAALAVYRAISGEEMLA